MSVYYTSKLQLLLNRRPCNCKRIDRLHRLEEILLRKANCQDLWCIAYTLVSFLGRCMFCRIEQLVGMKITFLSSCIQFGLTWLQYLHISLLTSLVSGQLKFFTVNRNTKVNGSYKNIDHYQAHNLLHKIVSFPILINDNI